MSTTAVFTEQQADVVAARDGELLVAATAGSGKTRVMVERFVAAVLDDDVPIGSILAISFTDKAAAELRLRIRQRLEELGQAEQARGAEGAFISTIHALCARILRTDPLAAGVDPGFTVLEEVDAQRLALRAFDAGLARWIRSHGAAAVELAALYRVESLRTMTIATVELLRSRGEREPALPPPPAPVELAPLRDALLAEGAAAAVALAAAPTNGALVTRALEALDGCAALAAIGRDSTDPLDGAALDALALPAAGRAAALGSPECERYRVALAAYRQGWIDARALPAWELLAELVGEYAAGYTALKRARSALDFNDLELEACALLRGGGQPRARWAERFRCVMVDEFQDTNPLQLELLELLGAGRLFVVGDEFQSIYRFRHADVSLFRARREVARRAGRARELSLNFRSHPALLAVLDEAFGGGVFAEQDFVGLTAGRQPEVAPTLADDAPRVELLVTDRPGWSADERPDLGEALPGALAWRLAEARLLAQRVGELVAGGRPPGEIVVLLRAATDIALYERALEDLGLPTYAIGGRGYFAQRQVADVIAYLRVVANPLDDEALLTVLASPIAGLDGGALVAIGAAKRQQGVAPWTVIERWQAGAEDQTRPGARTDDEPGRDAGDAGDGARGEGDDGGRHSSKMGTADDVSLTTLLDATMATRLREFVARLQEHRSAAPRLTLDALIDRVVVDTGYDLVALRLPGGRRRLANIRKLMRLAREHEAREGSREVSSLRGFLDRVRALSGEELPDREAEAPVEGDRVDAVRLMTIHRAKGLEFPVVCVADLGRRAPGGGGDRLRVGDDGAVGLLLPRWDGGGLAAFAYDRLARDERLSEAQEERRLMYVAMTRAQEHLILSGAGDPARWSEPPDGRTEPLWWIARAFLDDPATVFDPDAPDVEVRVGDDPLARLRCVLNAPATVGRVLRLGAPDPGAAVEPQAVVAATAAAAPTGPPAAPASAETPAAANAPAAVEPAPAGVPTQLSYSALELHAQCGYRFYLERVLGLPAVAPPAHVPGDEDGVDGEGDRRLEALDRGTLAHALLEHADLRRGSPPPAPAEVRALAPALGLAAPSHAECERVAALAAGFLASPLAARLAAARDLRREQRFTLAVAGARVAGGAATTGAGVAAGASFLIIGVIDAIAWEPDGALVVDYKSDAIGDGDDLAALVAGSYEIQRVIYALAALRAGAASVEVAHCYLLRPLEPVVARYSAADAPTLEAVVRERAERVANGDFTVTANPHRGLCASCPGRAGLCSWGPEMTLRARAGEVGFG